MEKREGNWRSMDLKTAEILDLVPCRVCFAEVWPEPHVKFMMASRRASHF
jgi:hypothetical protein